MHCSTELSKFFKNNSEVNPLLSINLDTLGSFINFLNTQMVILNQSIDYTMISKQSDLYQIYKRSVQFAMQIPRENLSIQFCVINEGWHMNRDAEMFWECLVLNIKCWSLVTMVVLLQKYTENNLNCIIIDRCMIWHQ